VPEVQRRRCTALARGGERCKLPPIRGGTVCWRHGGNAPQVRNAARRRLAEAAVRRTLDAVEVTEIDDPVLAFAGLASEALALKEMLAERVAALGEDLTTSTEAGVQLQAEVLLYERAMDRCAKFLETWIRLGLDERIVRVQERHVDALKQVLTRALEVLGQRPDDDEVRRVVATQLRVVEAEFESRSFTPTPVTSLERVEHVPNRRLLSTFGDDDDDDRPRRGGW
jgi:hypothetical protein